jgi:hypothetical protein
LYEKHKAWPLDGDYESGFWAAEGVIGQNNDTRSGRKIDRYILREKNPPS